MTLSRQHWHRFFWNSSAAETLPGDTGVLLLGGQLVPIGQRGAVTGGLGYPAPLSSVNWFDRCKPGSTPTRSGFPQREASPVHVATVPDLDDED